MLLKICFLVVDALNMFEKDEEIHLNDNFLLLPQVVSIACCNQPNAFECNLRLSLLLLQANEEANDIKSDNTLGSSWLANINRQDITRPSWFTSEDGEAESRISIGRFISARAEDIGALDHEPSSYPKVVIFKL